jgi:polyhydroxybutyrate depolymerase
VAGFGAGDTEVKYMVEGVARTAVIHVPARLGAVRSLVPALIAYHGYGDTAADFEQRSGLATTADQAGFVVVFPQGLAGHWNFEGSPSRPFDEMQDLGFFNALVATLGTSGCVDMRRVYLAGTSNGGGEANTLACRYADRIAGVAIVSGQIFVPPCVPSRPLPVVLFHAFGDSVVLYAGRLVGGPSPATLPIEDIASTWAMNNGCVGAPDVTALANGVIERSWTGCDGPVVLYGLPTNGNGWPGASIDGTKQVIGINDVAWGFLSHFAARTSP